MSLSFRTVNLCQPDARQLQTELAELCDEASAPLRVYRSEADAARPGRDAPVYFIRERRFSDMFREEIGDIFGFDTKTAAVNETIRLLERHLPRRINNVSQELHRNDLNQDVGKASVASSDHGFQQQEVSESVRRLLFRKVMGRDGEEPAHGMPCEQICESILALQDESRYLTRVPQGLSLCRRPASKVHADEKVDPPAEEDAITVDTDIWADESQPLNKVMANLGKGDPQDIWEARYKRQLRKVAPGVRTIVLSPANDQTRDHIIGLLRAVKEKIRASVQAGKSVSIMLAVEDPKLYHCIARQMYEDAGSSYLTRDRLGLEPSHGFRIGAIDRSQYDELLTHMLKLDEDATRPLRVEIGQSGFDRSVILHERTPNQLLEELVLRKEEIARREMNAYYALVHTFAPIFNDAKLRGLHDAAQSRRREVFTRLTEKIGTSLQADQTSGNAISMSHGSGWYRAVPEGFSIAAAEETPFGFIANTVILGSGTIPSMERRPADPVKDAASAFEAVWADPRKTRELNVAPEGDCVSTGEQVSIRWWQVACGDGLTHIENLYFVQEQQGSKLPKTREGFRKLYREMLRKAHGSILLEPIAEGWKTLLKDNRKVRIPDFSDANLHGMLDAIAERLPHESSANLSTMAPSLPPLSVVVSVPAGKHRDHLKELTVKNGMLAADNATQSSNAEVQSSEEEALPEAGDMGIGVFNYSWKPEYQSRTEKTPQKKSRKEERKVQQ